MKKCLSIVLTIFLFFALGGVALAGQMTIQNEVSVENRQGNTETSPVKKENRLSSKRMKDKPVADETSSNSSSNERMIRYKGFEDGEGEAKTGK